MAVRIPSGGEQQPVLELSKSRGDIEKGYFFNAYSPMRGGGGVTQVELL